jgi:uncharacterized protein YcbX
MSESVVALRRYPVKCMAGEPLEQVELDARGLVGDRWYAVQDGEGRYATGKNTRRFRQHDEVFGYRAATVEAGVQVRCGTESWLAGDPQLDAQLSRSLGEPVRVVPESGTSHFDDSPVSLVSTASLRWCAAELGVDADARRLRANLVIEASTAFIEESWVGTDVAIGSAVLRVVARTTRCRTIDLAQDGADATRRWLKPLGDSRQSQIGVYAQVVRPGTVRVGDPVIIREAA